MKNNIATLAEENQAEVYHIYVFKNKDENDDTKPQYLFYAQDKDEYDNCDIDAIINIEGPSYQYQDCFISKDVTFTLKEMAMGMQIVNQIYIGFKTMVPSRQWYGQLVNNVNLIKKV